MNTIIAAHMVMLEQDRYDHLDPTLLGHFAGLWKDGNGNEPAVSIIWD